MNGPTHLNFMEKKTKGGSEEMESPSQLQKSSPTSQNVSRKNENKEIYNMKTSKF